MVEIIGYNWISFEHLLVSLKQTSEDYNKDLAKNIDSPEKKNLNVGKNNQEMLSAIVSAIWSGSWFFSSQIFKKLMNLGYSYSNIFYITSALYLVGILLYYFLIRSYRLKHRM